MIHKKRRTFVRAHERRLPGHVFEKTHVQGHVREFETEGQIRRKFRARSKMSRAVDKAITAKNRGGRGNKRHLASWENDPSSGDISGVDTDGIRH